MSSYSGYRLMLYTCQVKCFDGVVRAFEQTGYFSDLKVLRQQLASWDRARGPAGEPYQYFETPEQAQHNEGACCVPDHLLPLLHTLWHGPQLHDYEFKEPRP